MARGRQPIPNRVGVQLRINEKLLDKVRVIAVKDSRSMNMMICHIIEAYVKKYERENGTIEVED